MGPHLVKRCVPNEILLLGLTVISIGNILVFTVLLHSRRVFWFQPSVHRKCILNQISVYTPIFCLCVSESRIV